MELTDEQVRRVAELARLGLTDEERSRFAAQLGAILDHIQLLNGVDTAHVSETAQVGELVNVWRDDVAEASLDAETALANAPERDGALFRVGAIQES